MVTARQLEAQSDALLRAIHADVGAYPAYTRSQLRRRERRDRDFGADAIAWREIPLPATPAEVRRAITGAHLDWDELRAAKMYEADYTLAQIALELYGPGDHLWRAESCLRSACVCIRIQLLKHPVSLLRQVEYEVGVLPCWVSPLYKRILELHLVECRRR
jgi:hypothetical protein